MFKQLVSWLVMITYSANLTSTAFAGFLIGGLVTMESAYAAPQMPVPIEFTCKEGTTLIAGQCIETEVRPMNVFCDSGYARDGSSELCKRNEEADQLPQCGDGYLYNSAYFPELCYTELPADDLGNCPANYDDKIGDSCFKTKAPEDWNCPMDAPNAAPETQTLECLEVARLMGECSSSETYTSPDMRWYETVPNKSCKRTLWSGLNRTCDSGFQPDGSGCKKTTITAPTQSCPTGYYKNGSQCSPGTPKLCPDGSAMTNGSCPTSSGEHACPSGMYLDKGSNICLENRSDSDPLSWSDQDFDFYFNQGTQLGGMIIDHNSVPDSTGDGQVTVSPSFINPNTTVQDPTLFQSVNSSGVDSNNGFESADETYQDEEKQSEYIEARLKSNNDFLDNQVDVAGQSSEEQVDNTNHSAVAYGTLMDSKNLNPPRKLSRESAMFQTSTNAVTDAFNGEGAYFGDCSADTVTYTELDESKIVTTNQSCFKPNKNNMSGCIVERHPIKPTLAIIEGMGDSRVEQCGDKCLQLTLGSELDNNLPQVGACGIYNKTIKIAVKDGFKLNRATLTRTHYDDHFRLYADNQIIFDGVHGSFTTSDGFPDGSVSCEKSESRDTYDPRDVTPQFQAALNNDNAIEFKYKVAVGGDGEAYAKVELIFDSSISSLWDEEIVEFPKGCSAALEKPAETYCTASGWECTLQYGSEDENFGVVDLSKGDRGEGYGLPGTHGDVLLLVARRDFDIAAGREKNCGQVVATTWNSDDGNDDDGIYFCEDFAGVGTHTSSSRQLRGTKLSNILPNKGEWETIAVRTDEIGSTWYRIDENDHLQQFASQKHGSGDYDSLKMSGYRIARAISENNLDWHNKAEGSLYFAYWQMLTNPSTSEVENALKEIKLEQPWIDYAPLYDGDNGIPICMEAYATDYVCDPLEGRTMNMSGGAFSFKDIINMDDACKPLDKDDQCDAISQTCVPGWEDEETNTCYAWDVKYECQDTTNALVTKVRENNTCLTDMNCIDGSCDVRADETNGDFINALTTYATMNEMGDSKNCTDPSDPSTCEVFSGEPRYCGWDQLKVNDCCKQPAGVNTLDVFILGQQMYTVNGYAASADGAFGGSALQEGLTSAGDAVTSGLDVAGQAVEGVWKDLTDPITDAASSAWNTVSSKLTSSVGNTAGNVTGDLLGDAGEVLGNFKNSITEALSNYKDQLLQQIYDMLPDALQNAIQSAASALGSGGAAAGAGAEQTGAQAMNTIGSSVLNAVQFIGFAYAVYQLAKLAYTMLTACEPEEEDMGQVLLAKKCFFTHHVPCTKTLGVCTNRAKDFHCCYESVLSRIIMQQAIEQLGWDTKEFRNNMNCRGLKIDELGLVDFSKIDFTEWIEMMAQSDQLPTDSTMDTVTGENISNGYGRSNALDRQNERAPDNTWVKRRTEMEQGDVINNVNCNKRPRPKSCEQGSF